MILLFFFILNSTNSNFKILEDFKNYLSSSKCGYYFLTKDKKEDLIIFDSKTKFPEKSTFGDFPNNEGKGIYHFYESLANKALFIYLKSDKSIIGSFYFNNLELIYKKIDNFDLKLIDLIENSALEWKKKKFSEKEKFISQIPIRFKKNFSIKDLKSIKDELKFFAIYNNEYFFTENNFSSEKEEKFIKNIVKKFLNSEKLKSKIVFIGFKKNSHNILCDGVFSFFNVSKEQKIYELDLFSVNNFFIGLGIGKFCLQTAQNFLFSSEKNLCKLVLNPYDSAKGFYEKLGYKEEKLNKYFFELSLSREDFFEKNKEEKFPKFFKLEIDI